MCYHIPSFFRPFLFLSLHHFCWATSRPFSSLLLGCLWGVIFLSHLKLCSYLYLPLSSHLCDVSGSYDPNQPTSISDLLALLTLEESATPFQPMSETQQATQPHERLSEKTQQARATARSLLMEPSADAMELDSIIGHEIGKKVLSRAFAKAMVPAQNLTAEKAAVMAGYAACKAPLPW